jgi:Transcriptional regulator containing PAS, AAA-type ATPase, and DNA-binding domains
MTMNVGIEDFTQLDAYHGLLPALARALDVHDIFQQLSAAAARIVPHDVANLFLRVDDTDNFRLYASTDADYELVYFDRVKAIHGDDLRQPRVHESASVGSDRGMQSALTAPVQINDQFFGLFGLASRQRQAYSDRDILHAQRLASYLAVAVSHQRLSEQARDAALQRERVANVEASVELLRTISDVLDVRQVFTRISEVANKILPHDALSMEVLDETGRIVQQAATAGVPLIKAPTSRLLHPPYVIIEDLINLDLPTCPIEDDNLRQRLLDAGFRSILIVTTHARDQEIGVAFVSRRPNGFSQDDLSVARRIVDHIALVVSHEQLAEAARQVTEAKTRADRLDTRVHMLTEELDSKTHKRVVGQSREWLDVLKKATQVAATDTTVLLAGESGTGKEVVARFIHGVSGRRNGPFVALNCAALPEQLLESELFGYERGAFTSAQQSKPGQIELAAGGVLFLDEVTEMSLASQAKFLRVLQEREFQRLGGTKMLKANIRVVAATNRDLRKAVERGDFREDLFYRLQVFDIRVAPLRERTTDILPLSDAFLQDIGKSFGRPPAGLTNEAREALLAHTWPGNVRELRNALERAAILADGRLIHAEHLALPAVSRVATPDLGSVERNTIVRALQETHWNKSKAAKRLGLSRTQLYVRIRRYGLDQQELQS